MIDIKCPAHRPQNEANLSKYAFFPNRPLSINRQQRVYWGQIGENRNKVH